MQFIIMTPSFRLSGWLKPCSVPVTNRVGVALESLVEDSFSGNGTHGGPAMKPIHPGMKGNR